MRKWIAVAVLALMPLVAQAEMPLTAGAGGFGYGANEVDQGDLFTSFWAGVRTIRVGEYSAIYLSAQSVGKNGGENGYGGQVILASGSEKAPWLYFLADVGWAESIAQNPDGSTDIGLTAGGGIWLHLSEHIGPMVYAKTYDAGDRFAYSIFWGLGVSDLQKLAGL